ncbi:hypothetical protein A0256_14465 [Mucilaginibacter sp. PAMC 26640]|nr:hypothetical protein A0256_14465 [Mucilaginibacter sp. PAMC 26640]
MEIDKDETKITGHWTFDGSKMIADDECKRIDSLRSHYLKYVSADPTCWLKLYQDPGDGRYWQLQFEHGEMQGGGPPSLILLSELEAKDKYNIGL